MQTPKVTFVVPCYKLAHLLPECVDSILAQSFKDFEVLIMDDASPDNTAEVAQSFKDPRVKYIRNDPNLGSLRNYNKGIGLAQGKYIWLISADDRLRRPYVLQRYVEVMERNPRIGFSFCAGVGLKDGAETGLLQYAAYSRRDQVIHGHNFLKKLLRRNIVLAPAGMVRRECYEKLGAFPLEEGMIYTGDWYLWCIFALHYDVAYFAEPMICYRQHELSMTSALKDGRGRTMTIGSIAVPWMIKRKAEQAGFANVAKECLAAVAPLYGRGVAANRFGMSKPALSFEEFEQSLTTNTANEEEREWLRPRVYAEMANAYYWKGDRTSARQYYTAAVKKNPWMLSAWAKQLLLSLGPLGDFIRRRLIARN